ncbi:MAG: fructose-6-phosphate aldolase [Pelagibacterales bacterium]|nr:fructose-6-phosphate aldolase [Pelagibacterales bacterium]MDB3955015.1 fructose-6-phosphate aldolase [Alphaproteobacteria bacterium]
MKFFIDTADVSEIQELSSSGFLDGVTTNPSLIKKSGRNINEVIAEICDIVPGPVSAEVAATSYEEMIKEAEVLKAIAKNVTIKVPLTWDGLKACRTLRNDDVLVNVTLCFSANQALLAAKAGATFVSPFVGRLDDIGLNGMNLISDICEIYSNYPNLNTEVLVASIRSPNHVIESAKIGADVVTLPANILKQLIHHPLTDNGLKAFLEDWKMTGQSIT